MAASGAVLIFVEETLELRRRDGAPAEPTLGINGLPGRGKVGGLLLGFDSFDNDAQVERIGHGENLRKNRDGDCFSADGLCKCLVDFDAVDGQIVEISQARVAGAKVVDVDAMACAAQLKDGLLGNLLAGRIAFGDFDAQAMGGDAGFGERISQHRHKVRIGEIGGGDIHVDAKAGTLAHHGSEIAEDMSNDELGDGADEAMFLSDLDENVWGNGLRSSSVHRARASASTILPVARSTMGR